MVTFCPKSFVEIVTNTCTVDEIKVLNKQFGLYFTPRWSDLSDKKFSKLCEQVLVFSEEK